MSENILSHWNLQCLEYETEVLSGFFGATFVLVNCMCSYTSEFLGISEAEEKVGIYNSCKQNAFLKIQFHLTGTVFYWIIFLVILKWILYRVLPILYTHFILDKNLPFFGGKYVDKDGNPD